MYAPPEAHGLWEQDTSRPLEVNPVVFLDVAAANKKLGRVTLELYADTAPYTVENFRAMCTGEAGISLRGVPFRYYGTHFHRIIKGVGCVGGYLNSHFGYFTDTVYADGFPDETFKGKAGKTTGPGTLMTHVQERDFNTSMFMITTADTPWFEGSNMVFGRVIDGMDVVYEMERYGDGLGEVRERVSIVGTGQLNNTAPKKYWAFELPRDLTQDWEPYAHGCRPETDEEEEESDAGDSNDTDGMR